MVLRTNPPFPSSNSLSVQSLGSGSSGNGFLIEQGDTLLLLDCGIGIRALQEALRSRDRSIADIDAILLTHEHVDHVRTLPRVVHREMPIVATGGTFRNLRLPEDHLLRVDGGRSLAFAGAEIWALPVLHDASEPCGYCLEFIDGRITVLTDLGAWHESLAGFVQASDLVVLEANHDVDMLRLGSYPPHLKRRVASDRGHLSNAQCGTAIAALANEGDWAPEIWLAHLSEKNNRPDLALGTVAASLIDWQHTANVTPLPRLSPGPVWTADGSNSTSRLQTLSVNRPGQTQLGLNLLDGC